MFTGIIQELGTVVSVERGREADRLKIHAPKTASGLGLGESVAINGVCLSTVQVVQGSLAFEAIPETRRLTTLGKLAVGQRVHVERSVTLSDRLNGHLVLGHVDGMARVLARRPLGGDVVLELGLGASLGRLVVSKGPIAVDGVSLTVGAKPAATRCAIFLIPETLRRTTLGDRRAGDVVNLEIDYVAKLVAQLIKARR